jgi:SAM-dependent methyltransferase
MRYNYLMPVRRAFDEKYYNRFYGDAVDRRAYRREEARLGNFVSAYLNYMQQPVRRVVDIGCGFGQWRKIIARHFPSATYTGVERSEYLCHKYGWLPGSAVDFRSGRPFDLVICKDTLQYLSARDFERAAGNLASICRGVLYASILTQEDWESNCDRRRTDRQVHLRSGDWYRRVLNRHFTNLGGGLFLSENSPSIAWDLESLPPAGRGARVTGCD